MSTHFVRFEPVRDEPGDVLRKGVMRGTVFLEGDWHQLNEFLKAKRVVGFQLDSPDCEGIVTGELEVREEDEEEAGQPGEIAPHLY